MLLLSLCIGASSLSAQTSPSRGTCFRGRIRAACNGFVVLEASANASQGGSHSSVVQNPPGSDPPRTTFFYDDLPSYLSGSFGYVRVVDARTAIGGVVEVGFPDDLTPSRVALMARCRRQLTDATLDVSAGPLTVGVRQQQVTGLEAPRAFGATVETALLYHGYAGLTGGIDVIHGAGRTTAGVRAGIRTGSYAAIATTVISGVVYVIAMSGYHAT